MAKAKKKTVKKAVKKPAIQTKTKKAPARKAPAKKTPPKTAKKKAAPKKAVKKTAKKTVRNAASSKTVPLKAKRSLGKATLPNVAAAPARKPTTDLTDFVTPLDDRIIVRLAAADRKTPGGLFIPETVSDVSGNLEGLVVTVGRGHRDPKGRVRPMDVKAGDRVLFSEYSGSKIRLKDEDFVILREGDVAGVLS